MALLKSKKTTSTASPSSTKPHISLYKFIKSVEYDFLLVNLTTDDFLVLLVPGNGTQDQLFYYLPKDQGEG